VSRQCPVGPLVKPPALSAKRSRLGLEQFVAKPRWRKGSAVLGDKKRKVRPGPIGQFIAQLADMLALHQNDWLVSVALTYYVQCPPPPGLDAIVERLESRTGVVGEAQMTE
jgi:hypothetical protein